MPAPTRQYVCTGFHPVYFLLYWMQSQHVARWCLSHEAVLAWQPNDGGCNTHAEEESRGALYLHGSALAPEMFRLLHNTLRHNEKLRLEVLVTIFLIQRCC